MSTGAPKATAFDETYFNRYYFDATSRIADRAYFDRLARFLGAYLAFLDCRTERILDAGCGPGFIHRGLRRAFPDVHIDAFDISAYVCDKYGWQCASIDAYDAKRPYDLVICHDVLQYLDRQSAANALDKFGKLTHGALYFSVLTREDWNSNCDQGLTDGDTYLRSSSWYRKKLSLEFVNAGGGLYFKRDADVALYALEHI